MSMDIATVGLVAGAGVWAASLLIVGGLAWRAFRGDPRVVVDDPWERPDNAIAWELLRSAARTAELDALIAEREAATRDRRRSEIRATRAQQTPARRRRAA